MKRDLEIKRLAVFDLLKQGTQSKLLQRDTERALDHIKQAYELANSDPALPQPWPAITAYRLAHLIMRRAKHTDDLLDAEDYLREAERANSLGPLPMVYRFAVLLRLKREGAELGTALNRAVERINNFNHEVQWKDSTVQNAGIQHAFFNMLEMAVYTTGYDYGVLEGIGAAPHLLQDGEPMSDFRPDEGQPWILVSNEEMVSQVYYPKAVALEELESRCERDEYDIVFKLNDSRFSEWKINSAGWERVPTSRLRFLASALYDHNNITNFCIMASGDINKDTKGPWYYQNKKRLTQLLSEKLEHLGLDKSELLKSILLDEEGSLPMLNKQIKVVGAMEV